VAFDGDGSWARDAWLALDFEGPPGVLSPDHGLNHSQGPGARSPNFPTDQPLLWLSSTAWCGPTGTPWRKTGQPLGSLVRSDHPAVLPPSGRVSRAVQLGLHLRLLASAYKDHAARSFARHPGAIISSAATVLFSHEPTPKMPNENLLQRRPCQRQVSAESEGPPILQWRTDRASEVVANFIPPEEPHASADGREGGPQIWPLARIHLAGKVRSKPSMRTCAGLMSGGHGHGDLPRVELFRDSALDEVSSHA
jgi:hypothetical protein